MLRIAVAVSIVAIGWGSHMSYADCQLARILELPVSEQHPQPTIAVQINGHDEHFVVDSGAIDNMISPAVAAQLKLQTYYPANAGVRRRGVAGRNLIEIARIKELKVAGLTIKDAELSVIGGDAIGDGVIGQNMLQHFMVEYDFGNGVMRLFASSSCESANFAYWLTPGQQYSSMRIGLVDAGNPYTTGDAYINGHRIRVTFDSGMPRSLLTREAAASAGVKLNSKGVVDVGFTKRIGWTPVKTYVGRFKSFKIGDHEQISDIDIPIGDFKLKTVDMLIGADFLMTHRIIVGNKEERLLWSYSGGPVFDAPLEKAAPAPAD
jgi:predicted aspartyl protease